MLGWSLLLCVEAFGQEGVGPISQDDAFGRKQSAFDELEDDVFAPIRHLEDEGASAGSACTTPAGRFG